MSEHFMTKVRGKIRLKHYSYRTEASYCHWIKTFIRFHRYCHPEEMGSSEATEFLTWLAVQRQVADNTQNLAFSSVLFMYKEVLNRPLKDIKAVRAKAPQKIPVVFSRDEVRRIMTVMQQPALLMVQLLYGSGLRLMEVLRLRIKDVDFEHCCIIVRDVKVKKTESLFYLIVPFLL